MDAHRKHMSAFLANLSGKQNTVVVSEIKHQAIIEHLKAPKDPVNAKLKWWAREKGMRLANFPDLDLKDVLVILKKGRGFFIHFHALPKKGGGLFIHFCVNLNSRCCIW